MNFFTIFFCAFIRIDVMKLEGRQLENDTNMRVQNMKHNMRGYAHIERTLVWVLLYWYIIVWISPKAHYFLFLVDSTLIIFPVSHYFFILLLFLEKLLRAFDSRKGISLNFSKKYIRVPGKLYRKIFMNLWFNKR